MLESIYASKLYRTSSRKDKIEAAFNNPINAELVGQLAKALDEEYKTPEYLVKQTDTSTDEVENGAAASQVDEPTSEGSQSSSPSHSSPGGSPSSNTPPSEEPEGADDPESSNSEESNVDNSSPESSEPAPVDVEESTSVPKTEVKGSLMRNPFKNMRQVADQIKGMLNFKDSTHGVNRILCKENEFWVYYNDDVNLNSVMAEVIETLNAASYTYLEFNRLARSDNAIVFLIDFMDSNMMQADPTEQKK